MSNTNPRHRIWKDSKAASQHDPWHEHDPWSSYQPPSKVSRPSVGQELRGEEIDVIAARVQQRMQSKSHGIKQSMGEDDSMHTDDRVCQLEERINQIETTTMHEQHRQQTQVTSELTTQLTAVQHQTQAIHSHIDQKMQEQLTNIDRLLGKRRDE